MKAPHSHRKASAGFCKYGTADIASLWVMMILLNVTTTSVVAQTPPAKVDSPEDIFSKMDRNKDGQVTLDEFKSISLRPSDMTDKKAAGSGKGGSSQVPIDPPKAPPSSVPGKPPTYPPGIDPPKYPSKGQTMDPKMKGEIFSFGKGGQLQVEPDPPKKPPPGVIPSVPGIIPPNKSNSSDQVLPDKPKAPPGA